MDNDFMAQVEIELDDLRTQVKMLTDAMLQIPHINMEADPSRPQGVVVSPPALVAK